MAKLGVPDEYEAWLVDSRTQLALVRLPVKALKWQRARNRIAQHEVTIAAADGGLQCCGAIGGLRGWSQMIQIVRDGAIVADGPVVGWSRAPAGLENAGDVTIRALDRFAITQKRRVGATRVGIESAGAHFYQLLVDANIGNMTYDPYPLTLPAAVSYLTAYSREYRVERLERVFDCIDELVRNTNAFFTCVGEAVYADELAIRHILGRAVAWDDVGRATKSVERPVLNERTTYGAPGIEVDAINQSTAAYVGGSNEGQSGAPLIGSSTFWDGAYTYGSLETAVMSTKARSQADVDAEALALATEYATPVMTIEQVRLTPEFGSEAMAADLSNLLPGAWLDIGYADTCAFQLPFAEVRYEYRAVVVDAVPMEGSALTPVTSDAIMMGRLEQLDVELTDEGEEIVMAALMPTAEWDGTTPTGWRDPAAGED